MKINADEIIVDDPLLKLFNSLIDNEDEKKILAMIFKGYEEKDILETLINYSSKLDNN